VREERRKRVVDAMVEAKLDWVVLAPSTNLEYLAGVKRRIPAYTRADHHGSWAEMAFLSAKNEMWYVAPRMVADFETINGEATQVLRLEETKAVEPQLHGILSRIGFSKGSVAIEDEVSARAVMCLVDAAPEVSLREGISLFQEVRRVKTDEELEILRRAGRITDEAFADVVSQIRVGMSEWDIAGELEYQMRRRGAEALSFPTVVYGYHENRPSSIREYREPRFAPIEDGTILAFDFGCVYEGYCSDFGRTVSIGEPNPKVHRFAKDLEEAHSLGIRELRAGVEATVVHQAVWRALDEAGWGKYFVHRTGHGIGMDVHEDPSLDASDATQLEPSMVFTIEPSVLVEGGLWIRNEDVVVVGENSGESLTQSSLGLVAL